MGGSKDANACKSSVKNAQLSQRHNRHLQPALENLKTDKTKVNSIQFLEIVNQTIITRIFAHFGGVLQVRVVIVVMLVLHLRISWLQIEFDLLSTEKVARFCFTS